jgi:hypothetical protein
MKTMPNEEVRRPLSSEGPSHQGSVEAKPAKRMRPRFTVSGAGVLHVRASDILRTEQAQRQIKVLPRLTRKPSKEGG